MHQIASCGVLDEVSLKLQAYVASVAGVFAHTVGESCQLVHILCVAHESLVYGVHRVLECERPFVLSYLHFEERELLPLGECVHHSRRVAQCRCVAVELNLCFPVEIFQYASLERQTRHAYVERVAFSVFLTAVLILRHYVSAEFDVAEDFHSLLFFLSVDVHRCEYEHDACHCFLVHHLNFMCLLVNCLYLRQPAAQHKFN